MSTHEILITTEDYMFVKRLFDFLNKQPNDEQKSTTVTILEDGTKELLTAVKEAADKIQDKRKQRISNAMQSIKDTCKLTAERKMFTLSELRNLGISDIDQEQPEDFNL